MVTVPGPDACACCAPHVKKTGEIGLIKLIGLQNYKGGVRVSMLCGTRAIADYDVKSEYMKTLSAMLSAPECEVVAEVERLKEEISGYKYEIVQLQKKMLECKVNAIEEAQDLVVLFETELEGNAPRELVNLILEKNTKIAAVFAMTDANQYRYVIGSRKVDVRPIAKMLNENFAGRGGGKPEMVQGSLCGIEEVVTKMLKTYCKELSDDI